MDNSHNRSSVTQWMLAAGAGALAMYLLDPPQRRRRLALARDQVRHWARRGRDTADAGLRDLGNRTVGLVAELRRTLRREPTDDEVLVARVRAQLGRLVSHPHAVEVHASGGCVRLSGPILKHEEAGLIDGVRAVQGVREVENQLEPHRTAGRLPALQGGNGRVGPRMEFMQENWAPGPRLAALAGGAALAWYGLAHRGAPGTLLGLAGLALAARAAANQNLGRLLGVRGGRRGIEVQKTIHIAAAPETVFDLWANPENFPRFMSLVEEVRPIDDRRSHWVVKGPAGTRVEWASEFTERVRPRLLAWRSEPGSPVQHAGIVTFEAAGDGTRATVRMTYNPPGGVLGHGVATLLGRDPKHELDADLMRMKAFLETGVTPRDAVQRTAPVVLPVGDGAAREDRGLRAV